MVAPRTPGPVGASLAQINRCETPAYVGCHVAKPELAREGECLTHFHRFEKSTHLGCHVSKSEPAYVCGSITGPIDLPVDKCSQGAGEHSQDYRVQFGDGECPWSIIETTSAQLSLPPLLEPDAWGPAHTLNYMSIGELLKKLAALGPLPEPQASARFAYHIQAQQAASEAQQCAFKCQRKRNRKSRSQKLIATHLNVLEDEDPAKVLIVKKIQRFGYGSAMILQAHFGNFGQVCRVLLSDTHEKQPGDSHRVRPSSMAFVIFGHAEDAARALAEGETQVVANHALSVSAFEHRKGGCSPPSVSGDATDGSSDGSADVIADF